MRKTDLLLMANRNLWRRKARTVLTCLGVIIGTASIVVMLSLGIGLRVSMEESMAQWGDLNLIRIHPGPQYDSEGQTTGEEQRLNDETLTELKALPGVTTVTPAYEVSGEARLGRKQGYFSLIGIDLETLEEMEFKLAHGRYPESTERFTVLAGYQVINNFRDERMLRGGSSHMEFEQQDPAELLDQRVQVTFNNMADYEKKQTYNFFVVGILDETQMDGAWNVYASINDIKRIRDFMRRGVDASQDPYTQKARVEIVGSTRQPAGNRRDNRQDDYNFIMVRAEDVGRAKEISAELRERGFNAWSMADNLEGIENTSRIIQAILGGIGGITLFVAALGITNTMIMSIYERTREIGIIKVIGASFSDVRSLFLAEASLIGIIGGLLGLGLSYTASAIINSFGAQYLQQGMTGGGMPPADISVIPLWLALFALGFAFFIGLVSGVYPANRAIKLSPIQAIRNE